MTSSVAPVTAQSLWQEPTKVLATGAVAGIGFGILGRGLFDVCAAPCPSTHATDCQRTVEVLGQTFSSPTQLGVALAGAAWVLFALVAVRAWWARGT